MFSLHSPNNQLLHRVGIPELRVNVNFKASAKKKHHRIKHKQTNKHHNRRSPLASFPDCLYVVNIHEQSLNHISKKVGMDVMQSH